MKVASFRIFVDDLASAYEFYHSCLGLHTGGGRLEDGYVVFNLEGMPLVIEEVGKDKSLSGRFTGLTLETNNIQYDFERLQENGVKFSSEPSETASGARIAHFEDSSGNIFSLIER